MANDAFEVAGVWARVTAGVSVMRSHRCQGFTADTGPKVLPRDPGAVGGQGLMRPPRLSSGVAFRNGRLMEVRRIGKSFVRVAPSVTPNEARSRLRRRETAFFEFVHSTCLDSITYLPTGRDHSAHIPDHGNFRRDCPHLAGDGPRPVRAGSGLALGF
jgi:hypothetical protein